MNILDIKQFAIEWEEELFPNQKFNDGVFMERLEWFEEQYLNYMMAGDEDVV